MHQVGDLFELHIKLRCQKVKNCVEGSEPPAAVRALAETYIALRRLYRSREYAFHTIIQNSRLQQISLGHLRPECTL
jgi:hypothetical protein